ncbi:hypothetical protein CY34DRAFT_16314 [Suillus luteus UH-Slu-Lm8-n1]|uniref:DUF6606 domain-containing protein n=1 Tax=Suillus luteus UH-Slu-Lm8-n1 TaxID=930992 RepID=A0A0D0AEL5_9AGAM|nr:hypothetical protein CY34DRAFT_16314 [Suillus luteus UH-Slu-Lm8-n1]
MAQYEAVNRLSKTKDQPILEYIINHVFLPLKLPQGSDQSLENDIALSQAVFDAAISFSDQLSSDKLLLWTSSLKMLRNLKNSIRFSVMSAKEVESQISAMDNTDVLVYMIRAQNAAVVMRKLESETIFESFEVSPDPTAVMGAKGKLICSYPGPAITVPDTNIDATCPAELANFLAHMDQDVLDAAATRTKARSTVREERDTTHPRYITELLTGILRGLGSIADVPRIRKRIGDDVLWDSAKLPWRRSPLWLVIRVALQTTLERSALGRTTYKSFMLFFMARLTTLVLDHKLSNDILHFMSAKMARRLFKLGSSASPELSQMVSTVTGDVRSVLEERWESVQDAQRVSPPWAPETLRVLQDTRLSLNTSREYIRQALQNQHSSPKTTPFSFSDRARGTIDDFLDGAASFLVAAHAVEPYLALADFETAVGSGIDDWVACVPLQSSDSACVSIEACASAYSSRALKAYEGNAENLSVMLLTLFELWVAMDKIVVGQIPLLAEYSPEIPLTLWECLLIRKASGLDRLKTLHGYLRARHCRASSRLSAFSLTKDDKSFAARYFHQSSELQSLKVRIESDGRTQREEKLMELRTLNEMYTDLETRAASLSHAYGVICGGLAYQPRRCACCRFGLEMEMLTITVPVWALPVVVVVVAAVLGVVYSARGGLFCDHVVSFSLRAPKDLIIRAKHVTHDSPILQLIPSHKFVNDLPTTLVEGQTHWLNLRTSEIEIRPAENAWKSSPDNWVLRFAASGFSTVRNSSGATLVDIRSKTWDMISKRLRPLEDARFIVVTHNQASGSAPSLKADLPRYGLEFFVDEDGELQSRNMRNMVVDVIQSTGTMLGLVNQLVLRPKLQVADEHPRTVIIPDGRVSYSADGHHVRVTIAPEGPRLTYQLYRVDADLRCLTGNVGLTSKLYQALLHAVTSGCVPDPLTGRTGTEEALHLLHSAACLSFMKLRSRDTDLLREISSLSTRRVWYPTHLQKMQTVPWSCLASFAQHHGFHPAAKSIMDYGTRLSTFSEGSANVQISYELPSITFHLLERASVRASAIHPDQFSLRLPLGDTDVIYASRHIPDKVAEERAFRTSFMFVDSVGKCPGHWPAAQFAVLQRLASTGFPRDLSFCIRLLS